MPDPSHSLISTRSSSDRRPADGDHSSGLITPPSGLVIPATVPSDTPTSAMICRYVFPCAANRITVRRTSGLNLWATCHLRNESSNHDRPTHSLRGPLESEVQVAQRLSPEV